jgi:hypothetical protein
MTEKKKKGSRDRARRRRERLDELALGHGFITWTKLETAALEGRLIIIRPTESAASSVTHTDKSSD